LCPKPADPSVICNPGPTLSFTVLCSKFAPGPAAIPRWLLAAVLRRSRAPESVAMPSWLRDLAVSHDAARADSNAGALVGIRVNPIDPISPALEE
jgi:hypothetical protein